MPEYCSMRVVQQRLLCVTLVYTEYFTTFVPLYILCYQEEVEYDLPKEEKKVSGMCVYLQEILTFSINYIYHMMTSYIEEASWLVTKLPHGNNHVSAP